MKVILSGGGTGGHIYPAIAIADKIKKEYPDAQIKFIGTKRGMEARLVPAAGYPIEFIEIQGFDRRHPLSNVKTISKYVKGSREAGKLIKEFKPDIVIGTGGYVCVPAVKAGAAYGADCYIHEQNAFPGMANKLLERYVKKVFLAFGEAAGYFKMPNKHVVCGNPVRKEFYDSSRSEARKALGIAQDKFVVLSFGGSLGAKAINNLMLELLPKLSENENIEVIMGTGRYYYGGIKEQLDGKYKNLTLLEYIDPMALYLKAADVVISRAGALTVSEISVCGRASVLIPSPNVTGNHQYFNAKAVADKGGAYLVQESTLDAAEVLSEISEIMNDSQLKENMEASARAALPDDACGVILNEIMCTGNETIKK